VSAISAVTVSPRRQRCNLYGLFYLANITQEEVVRFLRLLLRHLPGPIILIWDGGSVHRGPIVRQFLAWHARLHVEQLPAYAPELNPDELVWNYLKHHLANGSPDHVDDLLDDLTHLTRNLRRSPALLRAFVVGSELPVLFRS
jgi:transposase